MLECGCPETGHQCRCGCHTTLICPSKELCRERSFTLKRRGFPNFKPGETDYVDSDVAAWKCPFAHWRLPGGSNMPITHVRPVKPVARVSRPFYDFRTKHFCKGVYSVDLFSPDQIDFGRPLMTLEQALKVVEGWGPKQDKDEHGVLRGEQFKLQRMESHENVSGLVRLA
jgi:hypothetical protein